AHVHSPRPPVRMPLPSRTSPLPRFLRERATAQRCRVCVPSAMPQRPAPLPPRHGAEEGARMPAQNDLAVVTGAPGWLGTTLVEALAKGARFRSITTEPRRVRCVVQPGTDVTPLQRLGDNVEIVFADLRDRRAVADVCRDARTVFHAARIIHPRRIQELYDIHVKGTRNILDAALAAKARRFIFVSSNSPAGLNDVPGRLMTEDDPPRPYLNYGLSKLQSEWLVNDAHRAGQIEGVILRPCWVYG